MLIGWLEVASIKRRWFGGGGGPGAIRLDPGGALPIQLPIQCGSRARRAVREQSDLTQPRTARGARAQCGVRAAGEVPMLPSGMYISDLNIDYVSEFRVRACAKIRSVGIF